MSFKISKKETDNKTVRFSSDLVARIESAIVGEDITFSRFVILACEYALKSIEEDKKEKVINRIYLFFIYTLNYFFISN